MNEKGFFIIIGLGFLMIIFLSAKIVQETEKNYAYDAINFQSELELQNIADGSLVEAAEKIRLNPNKLTEPSSTELLLNRRYSQRKISVSSPPNSERFKNISVEVYGERGKIDFYNRNYSAEDDYTGGAGYKDATLNSQKTGIILISVASGEEKATKIKKFRKSLAYILDDEENIVHFMNKAERGNLKLN